MADSVEEVAKTSKSSKIVLTEDDIPGAKLIEYVGDCSSSVLRRWLLCRGAKTSGKLADLRRRVNDYMKNGLDKKYLRDPDGSLNLMRKKARQGVLTESVPQDQDITSFPKDGYSVDLSNVPKVTFGTVWRYMIENVACKKQVATAKPLVKGYNFFMSNHVLSLYYLAKDGKHYIKSQVLPSMKKSAVYTCYIVISSIGFVLQSKCGCPAGVDGRCNHVAATLFGLESFHKKKNNVEQSDVSCTSKTCKWSVPSKRKGPVQPINTMKFSKHVHGKEKKVRRQLIENGKDVRSPKHQIWADEKLKMMLNQLKEIQKETGQAIGWCHILPQEVPANLTPSTLEKEHEHTTHRDPLEFISPIKQTENPISFKGIKERCHRVKRKITMSTENAAEIEEKTRQQSDSFLWHFHRRCRITASKCYRVAVMKPTTSPTKAVRECLYSNVKPTKSMLQGIEKEPEIRALYIDKQIKSGHDGITVSISGLVISQTEGFLGASPDGIVFDPSVNDPNGLLEMKHIQINNDENLEHALLRKRMCVKLDETQIRINRNHQYFYQIQQAMYVTKRSWNDFVVKGSTSSELYIERVQFDCEWWDGVKKKIELFFDNHICPEIAFPRIKYGLPRLSLRRD